MKRTMLWLTVWLVLQGLAVTYGLWQARENDQALRAHDQAEAHQLVVDDAQRCVNAWEGREATRDMAEKVYRRNAETLLGLASDPESPTAQAYRTQVELDVVEIRAELPDPECDLAEARRVVDG